MSAQVAAFLGNFGQEYQLLSVQAEAFHEQFVYMLNAGAEAYLNTEAANAEQNLLNAVNAGAASTLNAGQAVSLLPGQLAAGAQTCPGTSSPSYRAR